MNSRKNRLLDDSMKTTAVSGASAVVGGAMEALWRQTCYEGEQIVIPVHEGEEQ
ncbi:hypothetical protein A2U01_0104719, partial [Trifolium medium]|nr:hypothetical protein [Trifolium medium]